MNNHSISHRIREPMRKNSKIKKSLASVGLIALAGGALLIPTASANQEDGRFFVHAWNADSPQFRATAGLQGLEPDGSSGDGGNTSDEPGTVDIISAPRDNWMAVTRGASQYLAIAINSGNTMHSSDGKLWERGEVSLPGGWQSAAYGNGRYVVVAHTGKTMSSADGTNWKEVASGSSSLKSIAFGNGVFVAVGDSKESSSILYSKDGLSWTEAQAPVTVAGTDVSGDLTLVKVNFVGGKFITTSAFTGVNMDTRSNFSFESSDGKSWKEVPLLPGATLELSQSSYSQNIIAEIPEGYLVAANEIEGWQATSTRIFSSTDGLKSWNEVQQTGLSPSASMLGSTGKAVVALNPLDATGASYSVVASKDGGRTWEDSGQHVAGPLFFVPSSVSADGCLVAPLAASDSLIRYCD